MGKILSKRPGAQAIQDSNVGRQQREGCDMNKGPAFRFSLFITLLLMQTCQAVVSDSNSEYGTGLFKQSMDL